MTSSSGFGTRLRPVTSAVAPSAARAATEDDNSVTRAVRPRRTRPTRPTTASLSSLPPTTEMPVGSPRKAGSVWMSKKPPFTAARALAAEAMAETFSRLATLVPRDAWYEPRKARGSTTMTRTLQGPVVTKPSSPWKSTFALTPASLSCLTTAAASAFWSSGQLPTRTMK